MSRILSSLLLFLVVARVDAAPIVYDVSRFPNGPVALTGTITTDGTIGVLRAANVIAWAFLLSDTLDDRTSAMSSDTGSFSLTGPQLTAYADRLEFLAFDPVFQYAMGFAGTAAPGYPVPAWGLNTRARFNGTGAESVQSTTGYTDFRFVFGSEVIGIAEGPVPATVPEPSVVFMLALGLVLVASRRRATRSADCAPAASP